MKKTIITLAAALVAISAQAQYVNGDKLLEFMDSESYVHQGIARGYVTGVVDALNRELFCVPEGSTVLQAYDTAKMYIRRHQQKLGQNNAGDLVKIALIQAYPCKSK